MWYIYNYIMPLSLCFADFWERERVSEHLIKNRSSPRVRLRRFVLTHFRVVLSLVSLFVFDFLETPFLLTVSRREAFEFERVSMSFSSSTMRKVVSKIIGVVLVMVVLLAILISTSSFLSGLSLDFYLSWWIKVIIYLSLKWWVLVILITFCFCLHYFIFVTKSKIPDPSHHLFLFL